MPTLVNNLRAIRGPVTAVPMVGASGVVVEPDTVNNQVIVRADETVLWSGSVGQIISTSNEEVTLSESPYNFEVIKFHVQGSALNEGRSTVEIIPNSSRGDAYYPISITYTNDGASILIDTCVVQITNGKFVFSKGARVQISSNGTITFGLQRGPLFLKIIGINRIAG